VHGSTEISYSGSSAFACRRSSGPTARPRSGNTATPMRKVRASGTPAPRPLGNRAFRPLPRETSALGPHPQRGDPSAHGALFRSRVCEEASDEFPPEASRSAAAARVDHAKAGRTIIQCFRTSAFLRFIGRRQMSRRSSARWGCRSCRSRARSRCSGRRERPKHQRRCTA